MKTEGITVLLDRYYSGNISPEEYKDLLSALDGSGALPPELEAEREMFRAIRSCEPEMPDGLEKRLKDAINNRSRRVSGFIKAFASAGVAASLVLCVTLAWRHTDNDAVRPDLVAQVRTDVPKTVKAVLPEQKDSSAINMSDEECERAVKIVDEALMSVLSRIHSKQKSATECVKGIHIKQVQI